MKQPTRWFFDERCQHEASQRGQRERISQCWSSRPKPQADKFVFFVININSFILRVDLFLVTPQREGSIMTLPDSLCLALRLNEYLNPPV